jgi:hypothetical protein
MRSEESVFMEVQRKQQSGFKAVVAFYRRRGAKRTVFPDRLSRGRFSGDPFQDGPCHPARRVGKNGKIFLAGSFHGAVFSPGQPLGRIQESQDNGGGELLPLLVGHLSANRVPRE